MGGFILGFDTNHEDIFDRMVDFIQKSGIPIAMAFCKRCRVRNFPRLLEKGRILNAGDGNNTDGTLNFLPRMDAARLMEGYRSVVKRIYGCEAYYERVSIFLNRCQPQGRKRVTYSDARALVTSIVRQGFFSEGRLRYFKFLLSAMTRYRRSFSAAMTLAVMGYHLQVVTRELLTCPSRSSFEPADFGDLETNTGTHTS